MKISTFWLCLRFYTNLHTYSGMGVVVMLWLASLATDHTIPYHVVWPAHKRQRKISRRSSLLDITGNADHPTGRAPHSRESRRSYDHRRVHHSSGEASRGHRGHHRVEAPRGAHQEHGQVSGHGDRGRRDDLQRDQLKTCFQLPHLLLHTSLHTYTHAQNINRDCFPTLLFHFIQVLLEAKICQIRLSFYRIWQTYRLCQEEPRKFKENLFTACYKIINRNAEEISRKKNKDWISVWVEVFFKLYNTTIHGRWMSNSSH